MDKSYQMLTTSTFTAILEAKDMEKAAFHLVKIGVAARTLHISVQTLRRWEKLGKIACVKTPGGTRLYPLDSLTAQDQLNVAKLSLKDAANTLGVSTRTLRRWEKKGRLTSLKTPRKTKFYALADLALIKENPYLQSLPLNEKASVIGVSSRTLRRWKKAVKPQVKIDKKVSLQTKKIYVIHKPIKLYQLIQKLRLK